MTLPSHRRITPFKLMRSMAVGRILLAKRFLHFPFTAGLPVGILAPRRHLFLVAQAVSALAPASLLVVAAGQPEPGLVAN